MKMKAAILFDVNQDMSIEEVEIDAPKEGEVLLRIAYAGVCHSDLSVVRGRANSNLPIILGHEASAVVEAIGPGVNRVKPGDHVVLSWFPSCGHCYYCYEDAPTQCETNMPAAVNGTLWDGTSRLHSQSRGPLNHFATQSSFAEYAVMPEQGCLKIDSDIPLQIAAIVGCAVTTGFGAVVRDAALQPGQNVAIWGIGGVGISAILGAVSIGAERIIAIDPNPRKEAISKSFGATHYINPNLTEDVPLAIRELTAGRGADATLECIGNAGAFDQAYHSARAAGTIVSVGQAPKGVDFIIRSARSFPAEQKRIIGSYYGGGTPERDFIRLLGLYKSGKLDLDRMIGKTVPLEKINDAMRELESGVDTRILIGF
ncbi:MAG: Zn-dependent alcohol dehydrogenase [Gammaproteobacteria bacterium]|jgi:Zn-dependent alcohol dehydrogenase